VNMKLDGKCQINYNPTLLLFIALTLVL